MSSPLVIKVLTVSISPLAIDTQKELTLKKVVASKVLTAEIEGIAFTDTIEKHNAIAEIMIVFFMMKDFNLINDYVF
jgi:hypothetical protein